MTYDELEKFIVKFSPKHPEWERLKMELNEAIVSNVDDKAMHKFLLGLDIGFKKNDAEE
jgi:hypothetical protein